ncbi:hypothetical protein LFM09_09680 [Lentzea alba]|uniref:hypothetical protein n=1 Tax=Lentzea alba TaxID=2714351 RepID=UPI0039BF2EA3
MGEYERAFYGDQFREVVARLNALGVEVWLPEAGGPVELGSPAHVGSAGADVGAGSGDIREDHLLEALPGPLERPGGLVEQDMRAELVDQVRRQRLQIEYDGQRLEMRPALPIVKTVEPARRPVQTTLVLDWSDGKKAVEI